MTIKLIVFLEKVLHGDEDHKRVGLFIGHELHLGKTSVLSQFGYYVYQPIPFESKILQSSRITKKIDRQHFCQRHRKSTWRQGRRCESRNRLPIQRSF